MRCSLPPWCSRRSPAGCGSVKSLGVEAEPLGTQAESGLSDETAPMGDTTTDRFLELETRVWQALTEGDASADASLLSEDFLGVYPTGFAGRDDHTGALTGGPTVA